MLYNTVFPSAIVCPWLDFNLPPRYPHGCAMPLRGNWAIFCHAGSGRVGRMWSARQNSLEIPSNGREFNPGQREDRQWDTFILPLSYHDPGHKRGQTVRYISPTELSWPGPRRGQTVRYTHSPTELSWPGRRRGQTLRYIRSPIDPCLPIVMKNIAARKRLNPILVAG